MQPKHTPGPWRYRGTLRTYIVEPSKASMYGPQRIAVVSKDIFAESQGNARLVTASPLMFDALECVYERLRQDDNYVGDPLLAKIYTALAAAKGNPHANPTD